MRVGIFSTAHLTGGAGIAASRLRSALQVQSIDAQLVVARRDNTDSSIVFPSTTFKKLEALAFPIVERKFAELDGPRGPSPRSSAILSLYSPSWINSQGFDIVNLHWVCSGLLSIKTIMQISAPVVWTLHDMWAFLGTEHICYDEDDQRAAIGYKYGDKSRSAARTWIDTWTWRRKQRLFSSKPFTIVCPSNWLTTHAKRSNLLKDHDIVCIPNALDTDTFRPIDREFAKSLFTLPSGINLVLFGSAQGTSSPIKGWDLLVEALSTLQKNGQEFLAVVFGELRPAKADLGFPCLWVDRISDSRLLSALYSAADVLVVPSKIENLPQVATESQACGCPVVAFRVGGLPDAIDHLETGYLADPYNSEDLANGITWAISERNSSSSLISSKARAKALRSWSFAKIAKQYTDLFLSVKSKG